MFDLPQPTEGAFCGQFFSDLSVRPGTDETLLTTVVARAVDSDVGDRDHPGQTGSLSRVALVKPALTSGALQFATPSLENVYEASWANDGQFLVATRGLPLHLYDMKGHSVASFSAYDGWSDEFEQAYATASSSTTVYAGSTNAVYAWDIRRPGKETVACMYPQWDDGYRESGLQHTEASARRRRKHDIISSVAVDLNSQLVAAGAYSGRVALFDSRTKVQEMFIDGLSNAVTQVAFHEGTCSLFVGCRGEGDVYAFDMRRGMDQGICVYELRRGLDTRSMQRVRFALSGRHVASGVGGGSGSAGESDGISFGFKVWDVRDGRELGDGLSARAVTQPGAAIVNACCFGETGETLAAASGSLTSRDSRITLYNVV